MHTPMTVPVTDVLLGELEATGRVLTDMARESRITNDRDDYATVIETLEPLVLATLSATANTPLTTAGAGCSARFDMGAGGQLAHHVNQCVSYLRGTAAGLLADGGFSPYEKDNTSTALDYLKRLNGLLISSVLNQSKQDPAAISNKGAGSLLNAASLLARLASSGDDSYSTKQYND